ncbi:FAD-dependent oxidoreductase [Pseudomonas pergaminensis]
MKNMYDVIVIGLGIMGASALWRVALKCNRVLGIDTSGPTHRHGSSQGESRIFRRAYWEGDKYLPLLNHANLLWNELEQSIMTQLLYRTGGLFIGSRSSQIIAGSIHTARQGKATLSMRYGTVQQLSKTFRHLKSSMACKRYSSLTHTR